MGVTHDTSGRPFGPSTTSRRRRSSAATISVTQSCGPSGAATPAHWVAAFTQEWAMTESSRAAS